MLEMLLLILFICQYIKIKLYHQFQQKSIITQNLWLTVNWFQISVDWLVSKLSTCNILVSRRRIKSKSVKRVSRSSDSCVDIRIYYANWTVGAVFLSQMFNGPVILQTSLQSYIIADLAELWIQTKPACWSFSVLSWDVIIIFYCKQSKQERSQLMPW